jgi:O-antigen ligase
MRRSPLTVFAAGMALLVPLLFTTVLANAAWFVRYAALALIIGVGLPATISLLRGSAARRAGALGVAFAAWCALCAALARVPTLAFFGVFGLGTGALFVVALVASWAIGASIEDDASSLVENALLAAAAINVVVALAQMAFNLDSLGLGLFDQRSSGLLGNPVFLAEMLAGTFWIVLHRSTGRGRWPAWALLSVGIGAGLQVSGSRLPLALALLALPVALLRVPRKLVAAMGLALLIGVAIGGVLTAHSGGAGTASRLAQPVGASGNRARFETWRSAPSAIAERPIVGFGPGRYGEATGPHRSLALGRSGPDRVFLDAHNLFVEYATTTGIPGLLLLVAFLVAILRRAQASIALLGFGVIVLAGHLVEPQNVAMTPLAFLALGAAGPAGARRAVPLAVRAISVLLGVAATAQLLVGGYYFQEAALDFNLSKARVALRLLPPWPQSAVLVGRVYSFRAKTIRHRPDLVRSSRHWQRVAGRRDPADATNLEDLAEGQMADGNRAAARRTLDAALHWNPWSSRGLDDLGTLELTDQHWDASIRAFEKSLRAKPDQPEAKRLLDQARAHSTQPLP